VSQLLPPTMRFDVVVFDEASQVREADAVGAIYRGDQLIVAGDPRQLPPTNFFQRLTDHDDEDVDDDLVDYESLLDRVKAQGLPVLQLRWHYRSRHEDLITFSNRSFYESRLHTFPGAIAAAPDVGVELFPVDGVYARGGARDNPVEAAAVVDRLLHHRREHPDLSVGIVALSGAQQLAIDAEIERRSRSEPELAALDRDDRLHGLFVKNLETVQGDERDVIILSIGYGRDEAGKLTANFGPMSRQGGERRLNVAVTRARRRIEVVCSFDPGEVTSDNATARHLLRYLDYARRGVAALTLDGGNGNGAGRGDREPVSPFEEDVLRVVRALGYDVQPRVGVAGYRIDIGVRHPGRSNGYVLGVECDGASYHSSTVARDRDRLRDQVLHGLGWTMHHVWSTEWHSNRAGEIARLRDAIEDALAGGRRASSSLDPSAPDAPDVTFDVPDYDGPPAWAGLYEEPVVRRRRSSRLTDDITDDRAQPELAQEVRVVVEAYGPIHLEVVTQAVCRAWGLRRVGSRAQEAVHLAARRLQRRRDIQTLDDFLFVPGREPEVRVPADDTVTPRRVRHVPPAELDLAIVQILRDGGPATRADLRTYWTRLFGWKRTGPEIESAFDASVDRLTRMAQITPTDDTDGAGDVLRLPEPPPPATDPPVL
jgi:very-short-patch-repair endonuclease